MKYLRFSFLIQMLKYLSFEHKSEGANNLSLRDFLASALALYEMIEIYGLQISPSDFTLSLGSVKDLYFLTPSFIKVTARKPTFHIKDKRKAFFFLDGKVSNCNADGKSRLSMLYLLHLYLSAIKGFMYDAQEYLENGLIVAFSTKEWNSDVFISELLPDCTTLINRILEVNKNEFTKMDFIPFTQGDKGKTVDSASSILTSRPTSDFSVDISLMQKCKKAFESVQLLASTGIYKLPPNPIVYSWMGKEEMFTDSLSITESCLNYSLMILDYNKKHFTDKTLTDWAEQNVKKFLLMFQSLIMSVGTMLRTISFNSETDRKLHRTFDCNQISFAQKLYPQELMDVVWKFFKHRVKASSEVKKQLKVILEGCKNDIDGYSQLISLLKKNKSGEDGYDKGSYRVDELEESGLFTQLKGVESFLDFGGNTGEIASSIGKKLGLKKENIVCFDIARWFETEKRTTFENVTYNIEKTNMIIQPSNEFDFVTAFVVFHHLENFDYSIRELVRVMKDGGVLLVREHDCPDNDYRVLIDIEHSLYEIVEKGAKGEVSWKYLQDYYAMYWSRKKLEEELKKYGFEKMNFKIVPKFSSEDGTKGPTRYYYALFRLEKLETNEKPIFYESSIPFDDEE